MVGLTRFFHLMNLCEKSGGLSNVYRVFVHFKKDANFEDVKKDFVLQDSPRFASVLESRWKSAEIQPRNMRNTRKVKNHLNRSERRECRLGIGHCQVAGGISLFRNNSERMERDANCANYR
jgi:hypothetical protein